MVSHSDGGGNWVVVSSNSAVCRVVISFPLIKFLIHHLKPIRIYPERVVGVEVVHQEPVHDDVLAGPIQLDWHVINGHIEFHKVVGVVNADPSSSSNLLSLVHFEKSCVIEI